MPRVQLYTLCALVWLMHFSFTARSQLLSQVCRTLPNGSQECTLQQTTPDAGTGSPVCTVNSTLKTNTSVCGNEPYLASLSFANTTLSILEGVVFQLAKVNVENGVFNETLFRNFGNDWMQPLVSAFNLAPGATLILMDVDLFVPSCQRFLKPFIEAVCGYEEGPPHQLQILDGSFVTVTYARFKEAVFENVRAYCRSELPSDPPVRLPCTHFNASSGFTFMDGLRNSSVSAPPNVYVTVNNSFTATSRDVAKRLPVNTKFNLTIRGVPGSPAPEVSLPNVTFLKLPITSTVSLDNVQVVNAPVGPARSLPSSILTSLLWMFDFPRSASTSIDPSVDDRLYLSVNNSVIHLPADELDWFVYWLGAVAVFKETGAVPAGFQQSELAAMARWLSDIQATVLEPNGPLTPFGVQRRVLLEQWTGNATWMRYRNVTLVSGADTQLTRLLNSTGILSLGLPLPAPYYTPLLAYDARNQSILPIDLAFTFTEAVGSSTTRIVITGNCSFPQSAYVAAPPQASQFVILNNVSIIGSSISTTYLDFQAISGGLMVAPNASVAFNRVTLMNLAPQVSDFTPQTTNLGLMLVSTGIEPGSHPLSNFSSLMWFFAPISPADLSLPQIYIYQSTLLLPPAEVKVIADLAVNGSTDFILSEAALQLIKSELSGQNVMLRPNGSIMFVGNFKFFRLAGQNLTMTPTPVVPPGVDAPTALRITGLPFLAIPTNATVASLPIISVSVPVSPSAGGGMSGGDTDLVLPLAVGIVLGLTVLASAVIAFVWYRRRSQQRLQKKEEEKEEEVVSNPADVPGGDVVVLVTNALGGGVDAQQQMNAQQMQMQTDGNDMAATAADDVAVKVSTWPGVVVIDNNKGITILPHSAPQADVDKRLSPILTRSEAVAAAAAGANVQAAAVVPSTGGSNSRQGAVGQQAQQAVALPSGDTSEFSTGTEGTSSGSSNKSKLQRVHEIMASAMHEVTLSIGDTAIELHSKLGAGAFGVVYKGSWKGLDVAIKRMLIQHMPSDDTNSSAKLRAIQEAALNTSLNHPNIVTTYAAELLPLNVTDVNRKPKSGSSGSSSPGRSGKLEDWHLYIIQEYCDGGSLADALVREMFMPKQCFIPDIKDRALDYVILVAINMAVGMCYLHTKNIVHGDLKPDNILLKAKADVPHKYVAKVADFGLAVRIAGDRTHVSNFKHGTPLYIAPEVLRDARVSKAADVYSFGIILWELYHGQLAWQYLMQKKPQAAQLVLAGMTGDSTVQLLPFAQPLIPQHQPFMALTQACMSHDPAVRPTFASIVDALCDMMIYRLHRHPSLLVASQAHDHHDHHHVTHHQPDPAAPAQAALPQQQGGVAAAIAHAAADTTAVELPPPPPPPPPATASPQQQQQQPQVGMVEYGGGADVDVDIQGSILPGQQQGTVQQQGPGPDQSEGVQQQQQGYQQPSFRSLLLSEAACGQCSSDTPWSFEG